ncbi:MAG TPA: hypothetical protein VMY77_16820 [Chitinophagaceae bacterium]|nr:hypothetical protein [Chitinophagaceae bacterium]
MKQQPSNRNILFGISFCIILAFSAMAFQDSSKINKHIQQSALDTVPKNNDIDINIDMKGLEENIKKSLEMAQKNIQNIDWNKMQKQMEQSMKQVDMAKLQMEINNSMKAVDFKKMQAEIERSMKEIDMTKLQLNLEDLQMNVDKEVKDAMKNINTDEFKKSMEELKKINFDDMKKEMEKVQKEMELNKDHFKLDMEKLKLDMEKVKVEMGEIKHMTEEMEKDGLINKTESNTIEYKDKELFINGKKQSPQMTEKYRKYFKGDNFKFKFNGN